MGRRGRLVRPPHGDGVGRVGVGRVGRGRVGCMSAVGVAVAMTLAACQGAEPQATPSLTSATASLSSSTPIPTSTAPVTTRGTTPAAGLGSQSGTSTRPLGTPSGPRPATTKPTGPATSPTSGPRPTTATPTTTPASCSIPSRLLGRDLTTLGTTRKVVALTFDGGGDNHGVGSVLRTLATQGVPASFFLTGEFVDDFPASAKSIAATHPVGNHSYHHPDLTTLSSAEVRTEVRSAAVRIKAVTGQDPRPWFRFPLGAVDARTIGIVNAECYVPFRWTVDTLGWKGTSGGQSVSSVVGRVVAGLLPGQIVLMHLGAHPTDHSTLDADALPRVIAELRARGYSFVTLGAVIGPSP